MFEAGDKVCKRGRPGSKAGVELHKGGGRPVFAGGVKDLVEPVTPKKGAMMKFPCKLLVTMARGILALGLPIGYGTQ